MGSSNGRIGVAIIGCGTVGGATAELLQADGTKLGSRVGRPIELRHVVDVDLSHAAELGIEEKICTTDINDALSDPEVHCVVELVGGTTIAFEFTKMALEKAITSVGMAFRQKLI